VKTGVELTLLFLYLFITESLSCQDSSRNAQQTFWHTSSLQDHTKSELPNVSDQEGRKEKRF
jgi:hypothetical protein